jgi:hypothetical protein
MFHFHCRDTIQKVMPIVRSDLSQLDALADHIAAFSLAAIKSVRAAQVAPSPRDRRVRNGQSRKVAKRGSRAEARA